MEHLEKAGNQEQAVACVSERKSLSGWRIHPQALKVVLGVLWVSMLAEALLPKEYTLLRGIFYGFAMFAGGLLSARHAAMWQRLSAERERSVNC
ncbi:hypothetical protein KTD31_01035 [Burkholderia multivorans]|uniref:hypothetical protein n=1 Tax=Burkholderia multivorans TaxID=87883 RepID=UPI001C22C123|nr:hypothetical protein [Burkholderia multivorans]MBU9199986.1 hypothetical protein [Burkholderia multivorans]MDN8078895.1 hypothetical protein [Burkholderia multivorans]